MSKQVERIMVWPQIVPIRMAIKLEAAGIGKSSSVHEHIRNGTLQSLKGIGRAWEARITDLYSSAPRQLAKDVLAGRTEFVTTQGLGASGHLLLAQGHLVAAKEQLYQGRPPGLSYHIRYKVVGALNLVRSILKELKAEKEEPCKKS